MSAHPTEAICAAAPQTSYTRPVDDSSRLIAPADDNRWTPERYLQFADQRLRPALDLLHRVRLESAERVVDLGCGTGEVTRLLAERFAGAEVRGLDHSPQMLERAGATASRVRWQQVDIAAWEPEEPADLIFSNAALHWLSGHRQLFPRLLGLLRPGGCLAVQMPLSWQAPSHRLMRQTLADGGPDSGPLGSEELRRTLSRNRVEEAELYHDLLAPLTRTLDIWETEYLQVLTGEDPVFAWVAGAGLRPVLNALDGEELERFSRLYRRRLHGAYPPRPDGTTLYPFRRLFIVAHAPE